MTCTVLFIIAGCLVLLAGGLWHVWTSRSHRNAFKWGLAIIVAALASALFAPLYFNVGVRPEQTTFLTNFFLIIASVGANMVASSATYGIER